MSSRTRLIAGTVAVAALAAGGAAFAAVELSSSSNATVEPIVSQPFGQGIAASGLGGGRLGGRGLGGGLGPGAGPGGLRRPGGFFGPGLLGGSTGAAATYLGVTEAALQADLQNGKTLAQVAKAQGKSVDGLVAAMVAAQKKRLESAVTSGFLTQAQEQQLETRMAQRMSDLVNGVRPKFGRGLGGDRGFEPGGAGGASSSGTGSFGATA
jgi:hypothetical protein